MNTPILIILIVLCVYLVIGFAFSLLYMKGSFRSFQMDPDTGIAHYDFYQDKYDRREISFLSGENRLKGAVYGLGNKKGLIVFSHGIWSGPEEYLMMLLYFVDQGYTVFTYTYTSYNGSEGKWAKGLPQSPKDLHAALTYIENDGAFKGLPIFLLGHSWGGFASTAVLNFDHQIAGVVSLSGFNDVMEITDDVARHVVTSVGAILLDPFLRLLNRLISGKNWRYNAVDGINKSNIPVLLVHGVEDDFILYDKTSIPAHLKEITNPYVGTLTLQVKNRSGHNNYFGNEETSRYTAEFTKEWKSIEKATPKKLRREKQREFFDKIDLDKANQLNEDLFSRIEKFYSIVNSGEAISEQVTNEKMDAFAEKG